MSSHGFAAGCAIALSHGAAKGAIINGFMGQDG